MLLVSTGVCRADMGDVRIIRDVAYRNLHPGEDSSLNKNKLDLYLPSKRRDFPVIFFVHGGAWFHGDKNYLGLYTTLGLAWARQGFGTVVINYRLSPGVQHPEHIRDVASAFAWTHQHIQAYGGRADQVFVCGHSAGGHLVALLATDDRYLKAEGLCLKAIRGVIPISGVFRVHGLEVNAGLPTHANGQSPAFPRRRVPFSRVFGGDPAVRKDASPLTHVRPGLPPFLIMFADHDLPTLGEMGREFGEALRANHDDVRTLEIKHRDHFSILLNVCREEDPAFRAIREFIEQHTGKP
jgi:acetyl esterase/lipase